MSVHRSQRSPYDDVLHATVLDYIEKGFAVVPLAPRGKAPRFKGWKERSFVVADFRSSANVALRHEDGLCDVDLDWREARDLVYEILPKSACFGRTSASPSHVLYVCKDLAKTSKFVLPAACKDDARFGGDHAAMVLELRTGHATMVPPSIHPSGEQLAWLETDVADIGADELRRKSGLLAFLSVVLRCYPATGSRNEVGIALSAALVRAGFEPDEANEFTRKVARHAGDEDSEQRGDAKSARERLDAGKDVTGLPRLCELLSLPAEMAQEFARWLMQVSPTSGAIVLDNDREPENLDRMDAAFAASDLTHYQRFGKLVHVTCNAATADGTGGELVIRESSRRVIQQDVQRISKFMKFDARRAGGGGYVSAPCPDRLAEMYLCKSNGWTLPELRGIRQSPTLRPDGSVLQTPGYDAVTGYFYQPRREYPVIPEIPTRADAEAALDILRHVVRDFEFATPADGSVWGAAVLTSAVRPALPTAPIFGFDAPQFGAGKTLLANLVNLIVHGTKLVAKGWVDREEENEKRLYSALLAGESSYLADNIRKGLSFGGEAIAAILTQEQWAARRLGKSEQVPVSTRATFYVTGVNLTFTADLVRRALKCRIEPGAEHPEGRTFGYSIEAETLRCHPQLLVASLTIIRAYVVAGCPMSGKFRPMGSFEEFDRLVRGALLWLGMADPLETQKDIESIDPESDTLGRGLEHLATTFATNAFQVRDIADLSLKVRTEAGTALLDWIRETTPPSRDGSTINAKALGHYLKSKRGTPREGRRLEIVKAGTADANGKLQRNGTIWRVVTSLPGEM